MGADSDERAFDALSENKRLGDIAAIAWAVMASALDGQAPDTRAEQTTARAAALHLSPDDTATPFGNALDLLKRGPEDAAERALARALAAHALAARPPSRSEDSERTA